MAVNVPGPPIEATIALSIAFVAAEIIHGRQGRPGLTERYPWTVAFIFGLLHGFGFASALTQIGLPQQSITLAAILRRGVAGPRETVSGRLYTGAGL